MVIPAADVDGEALATLAVNKQRNNLDVLAVGLADLPKRSPGLLEDLAILTGGQVISQKQGRRLAFARLADLGSARLVVAHAHETLLVETRGEPSALQRRISQLRSMLDKTTTNDERAALRKHLANLAGGVAVIQVGGFTEAELKKQQQRYEDGLSVTRAALEEGAVASGGAGLLMALPALDELLTEAPELQVGVQVLHRALEEPLHLDARQMGRKGEEGVAELAGQPGYGIDRRTGAYVNMVAVGCIEPIRIVRQAVFLAVEIALKFFELNAQEE